MTVPDRYTTETIEAPKYISRGEYDITGNVDIAAFTLLKNSLTLESGAIGSSGFTTPRQITAPYDDISGCSGCIGATLRRIEKIDATGLQNVNQNLGHRKMAVLHQGICKLSYESGLLDGTVKTLKFGDKIAPCTSGFRVYEEINYTNCEENTGDIVNGLVTTGLRQTDLGWYADFKSDATGTKKRVYINPKQIVGVYP